MNTKLKNEFSSMAIPEMKASILAAVHREKKIVTRRRYQSVLISTMGALFATIALFIFAIIGEYLNRNTTK